MPFTKASYRVEARVGSHNWTVRDNDDPTVLVGLLDGLQISRSLPDGVPLPWQPDPATASLGVVVASALDVADVQVGDVVDVRYFSGRDSVTPVERFSGRVTDAVVGPQELTRTNVDGVVTITPCTMLQVTAVDYFADLTGRTIALPAAGSEDTAQMPLDTRLAQIVAAAMTPYGTPWSWSVAPNTDPSQYMVGVAAVTGNAFELLDNLFRQWMRDGTVYSSRGTGQFEEPAYRAGFRPVVSPAGELTGWEGWWMTNYSDPTELPLRWGAHPAYGVRAASPIDDPRTANAQYVSFDSSWSRTKGSKFTRVAAEWNKLVLDPVSGEQVVTPTVTTYSNGDPVASVATVSTQLSLPSVVDDVATVYLPPATGPSWDSGDFLWFVGREAWGKWVPGLGKLFAVVNMHHTGEVNPNNRNWSAGVLRNYTLTVSDGQPTIRFRMTDPARRLLNVTQPAADAFGWNNPGLGAVTWSQLDPLDSWADYSLVKDVN